MSQEPGQPLAADVVNVPGSSSSQAAVDYQYRDGVVAQSSLETVGVAVPETQEPRVDAALALLAGLDQVSPSEASTVLGQVHERLHSALLEP